MAVGVDGQLHGEDGREGRVDPLQQHARRRLAAVAVGEGRDYLRLGGVDGEVLRGARMRPVSRGSQESRIEQPSRKVDK